LSRFGKQAFRFVNLASLSPHRGLSPERADIWTRLRQMLTDSESFVITPAGLKNGCSHSSTTVTINTQAFSLGEIGQHFGEAMQSGTRLRACQDSSAIIGRLTYELFSQRLSLLIIRNASQKLAAHDQ